MSHDAPKRRGAPEDEDEITMMLGAFLQSPAPPPAVRNAAPSSTAVNGAAGVGSNFNGNDNDNDSNTGRSQSRPCYFELRSTPKPQLIANRHPPGSVLIRTIAASICGSDFYGEGPTSISSSCCDGCTNWRKSLDLLSILTTKNGQQEEQPSSSGNDSDNNNNSASSNSICGGAGHELIGEIVDVVQPCKYQIGQQVLGFCSMYFKYAVKDEFQLRSGIQDMSVYNDQGGFAQYFISHDVVCWPIPTTTTPTSPISASSSLSSSTEPFPSHYCYVLAQPLATVVHAIQHLPNNLIGKTIAIVGQGQNGLIATQLLADYLPKRLIVLDTLQERLDFSISHYPKVTHTVLVERSKSTTTTTMIEDTKTKILDITDGELCDVCIDMVGHQNQTLDLCAQLTKSNGTVLMFGIPPAVSEAEHQFMIHQNLINKNIQYVTSHTPPLDTFQFAMELIQQGRFDSTDLFTHVVPFEPEFPHIYNTAQNYRDGVIKVLVTF